MKQFESHQLEKSLQLDKSHQLNMSHQLDKAINSYYVR